MKNDGSVSSKCDKKYPLLFPALLHTGNTLIPLDKSEFTKYLLAKRLEGDLYEFKAAGNPKTQHNFMVASNGAVLKFEVLRLKRTWAKHLMWLCDMVRAEVMVLPPKQYKVGELLKLIEPLKSPAGYPYAGHLKGFLRSKDQNILFDEDMFKEVWERHCPPIPKQNWNDQF